MKSSLKSSTAFAVLGKEAGELSSSTASSSSTDEAPEVGQSD